MNLNSYLTNLYVLRVADKNINKFRNALWRANYLESLFENYPDRGRMIVSTRIYPFKIENTFLDAPTDMRFATSYLKDDNNIAVTARPIHKERSDYSFHWSFNSDVISALISDFRDLSTISEYSMYVPMFGIIPFDVRWLLESDELFVLNVYIEVNFGSGEAILTLTRPVQGRYEHIILYQTKTNITLDVPVSGGDLSNDKLGKFLVSTTIGAANLAVGMLAGGSTTSTTTTSGGVNTIVNKTRSPQTNRMVQSSSQTVSTSPVTRTTESVSRSSPTYAIQHSMYNNLNMLSAAQGVTTTRCDGGGVLAFSSRICGYPYIIQRKPEYVFYDNYNKYNGRPLQEYRLIGNLNGYTVMDVVHIDVPASSEEIEEIEKLLKSGVIINSH